MYKIRCEVWGGPTGHRVAWLKRGDRELVWRDDDYASAKAEADKLNAKTVPYGSHCTTQFRYTVVPVAANERADGTTGPWLPPRAH